jgi:hypothetical protein
LFPESRRRSREKSLEELASDLYNFEERINRELENLKKGMEQLRRECAPTRNPVARLFPETTIMEDNPT